MRFLPFSSMINSTSSFWFACTRPWNFIMTAARLPMVNADHEAKDSCALATAASTSFGPLISTCAMSSPVAGATTLRGFFPAGAP